MYHNLDCCNVHNFKEQLGINVKNTNIFVLKLKTCNFIKMICKRYVAVLTQVCVEESHWFKVNSNVIGQQALSVM